MQRGEIYRVHEPPGDTKQYRAYVIVSRQVRVDEGFPMVICAPIYTNGTGLPTQVSVGPDEGLKHPSWVLCDNLTSIPKADLTRYVGSFSPSRIRELDQALGTALELWP
jgi:mRNA interferase MazF